MLAVGIPVNPAATQNVDPVTHISFTRKSKVTLCPLATVYLLVPTRPFAVKANVVAPPVAPMVISLVTYGNSILTAVPAAAVLLVRNGNPEV